MHNQHTVLPHLSLRLWHLHENVLVVHEIMNGIVPRFVGAGVYTSLAVCLCDSRVMSRRIIHEVSAIVLEAAALGGMMQTEPVPDLMNGRRAVIITFTVVWKILLFDDTSI